MASSDCFRMTWTSKNLMWKFNFDTCLPKPTLTYCTLCEVTFGKVDTYHHQCALASVVLILSHASKVYLLILSNY
jgi:hypothetical protein